ncbi:MAG: oligosaccharide flippase family protein, partial [Bacillota bacterium]|nr:oligosaccharide flippase family protein [Bacillota bacterium]
MSRTEKSVKNIIWVIASQAITGVLAFAVRTALIKTVGIDAIAINGVLMEIVSVISLAEMGFGTLLIYNLHAPLANGDKSRVSCLMNLFGRIYKIVAAVELSIGLLLIPFVGYIISTDTFTDVYVMVVLVLFLIRGALNCAVVPKTALLNADQKQYVVSAVILVFRVLGTCLLLIILCIWNEYVIFVLLDVAITLGMNCAIAIIVKKRYAYLNSKEKLCLQEMKRILSGAKDVFVKNASGKVTHATDHLMISLMIGIEAVGYYSNYAMFLNIVKRIGG